MNHNALIVLAIILLFVAGIGLASAQVRVPDPTPPNPAPNIPAPPAPQVPKVTPPAPPAPEPAASAPVTQTDKAPAKTEKPVDKTPAGQDTLSHLAIGAIALVMLVFGILIGRMSVKIKGVKE